MAVLKYDVVVPERVPVAILFVETRGFTRMSEILEPSVVLANISKFFTLVSAAVERHEGGVCNVFNDTLVATFTGQGNAQHAVRAAQEIQQDFAFLAEVWNRDCNLRAAVAMGLHCGDTVVGLAGGSMPEQRLIIGDSVSVAERLLHRARAGEFVLSKAMMDTLAATEFVLEAEELPPLKIPRREPIRVFGVLLDTRLDFT